MPPECPLPALHNTRSLFYPDNILHCYPINKVRQDAVLIKPYYEQTFFLSYNTYEAIRQLPLHQFLDTMNQEHEHNGHNTSVSIAPTAHCPISKEEYNHKTLQMNNIYSTDDVSKLQKPNQYFQSANQPLSPVCQILSNQYDI